MRDASPGRIIVGIAPGLIVVRGTAPGHIVIISALPGRTIVRGAAPSRILAGLSRYTRLRARPYHYTLCGAQLCPRRCRLPSCTIERSTVPRLVLTSAGTGRTIVRGAAP